MKNLHGIYDVVYTFPGPQLAPCETLPNLAPSLAINLLKNFFNKIVERDRLRLFLNQYIKTLLTL